MKNRIIRRIFKKSIHRQLAADLLGKDSYRGVTLTYTWLANQFGHFSLGFIPTLIVYAFSTSFAPGINTEIWAASNVSMLWLLFELYNFSGPLFLKRKSKSKQFFVPGPRYTFQPCWRNIAFDTLTDLYFFWSGAFCAALFCHPTYTTVIILLILTALLIRPCRYWYLTKMFIQEAGYPYQFRLCQWENFPISDNDKTTINQFLSNKSSGKHLLVFGTKQSGKTALSVGIATEKSIKHESCCYVTAMKLLSTFFEPNEKSEKKTSKKLWNWRSASLLIIDDINPGYPVSGELISPEIFLTYLTNDKFGKENAEAIKRKNSIWVMGDATTISQENWVRLLQSIGVDASKIKIINLG